MEGNILSRFLPHINEDSHQRRSRKETACLDISSNSRLLLPEPIFRVRVRVCVWVLIIYTSLTRVLDVG